MTRRVGAITLRRTLVASLPAALAVLTTAAAARAASLEPVDGFDARGLPPDVSMSVYVPDNVAESPPVLVLIHYCGGTAPAVFGQARGGGIVAAADQYGFIMVVPSSGRCWDVVSNQARQRDGGGDSHAIRRMVQYAIDAYGGNAARVYVTGDSSGGMMTELLLALYPDVFKAGSAFAGMPAGCRGANESGDGGGYSGACAGGSVAHSAQEWGEIARALHPGYMGRRPRVQLFHGDQDTTIRYPNHTEAIKQWSDVLGLSPAPSTILSGLPLGSHEATRQTWLSACGHVALDAFTSIGGDHGPSDALFVAEHVVPFLGLDVVGPVDPEIERCAAAEPADAGDGAAGEGEGAGPAAMGGASGVVDVGGALPEGEAAPAAGAPGSDSSDASQMGPALGGSTAEPSSANGGSAPLTSADSGRCTLGVEAQNDARLSGVFSLGLALIAAARRRYRCARLAAPGNDRSVPGRGVTGTNAASSTR
jgi:acetylxylan esterase